MTFYDRYRKLCLDRGMMPHSRRTTDLLGVSNASVTQWKNGVVPRTETLERIAKFFGVSIEYLVNGTDERYFDEEFVNGDKELTEFLEMLATREECRMMFRVAKDSSKENVELAVKIIEELRNRGK